MPFYLLIMTLASTIKNIIKARRKVFGEGEKYPEVTQSTAIMYAFIHGLVELNISEHSESEKGLDSSTYIIDSFLDLIFFRQDVSL